MELLLNKIVSSLLQIIVFSVIPFVWWMISARKHTSFYSWIGLTKVKNTNRKVLYGWMGVTAVTFVLLSIFLLSIISNVEKATSVFEGLGISALPAALVYAFFNTALPEEILFRGFLLKRVARKFGFNIGNIIQSIMFGLLHGVMFISAVGILKAIFIILFTSSIAWCMGYINEKHADGSILPSWIIHSIANVFSAAVSMFSII